MNIEPTLEFLALHLRKGGRQQYIANWSLKTVLFCLGSLANDATQGSGLRLSHPRVRKLANQWLAEPSIPPSPPLIVAIDKPTKFTPLPDFPESGFGIISLPLSAIIDVVDGIHRIAALRQMELSLKILTETEWPIELIECTVGDDTSKLTTQIRERLKSRPRVKKTKI